MGHILKSLIGNLKTAEIFLQNELRGPQIRQYRSVTYLYSHLRTFLTLMRLASTAELDDRRSAFVSHAQLLCVDLPKAQSF